MKLLISTTVLLIVNFISAFAAADTLLITLKNGEVEKIDISQLQKIQFGSVTGVDEQERQSRNLAIKGNYPNPFHEHTIIEFEIEKAGQVEIFIYNNIGKKIQKLECGSCQAGRNTLQWNCRDMNNRYVQSGVYYYEVRFNNEIQKKNMILIR